MEWQVRKRGMEMFVPASCFPVLHLVLSAAVTHWQRIHMPFAQCPTIYASLATMIVRLLVRTADLTAVHIAIDPSTKHLNKS